MMKRVFQSGNHLLRSLKKEFTTHPFSSVCLIIVLIIATALRVVRTNEILGFYFDQGRDALVIADLLQKGKWFLLGPTTGIAGIFRGPFYYYLITPFYWIGNGNPVYPAVFLELLSVAALVLLYKAGEILESRLAGLVAVTLATFSYYVLYASRWLSNPTPMLFLSLLLFLLMVCIQKGKTWCWIPLSFVAGISLFHFGSSGEFFYFPALFIFALWQWGVFTHRLKFPSTIIVFSSAVAFFVTAAPLIFFDLRHDHILLHNIMKFFVSDGSFKGTIWTIFSERKTFLVDTFYTKIFLSKDPLSVSLMSIAILIGLYNAKKLWKNMYFRTLTLLLISPCVGLLFFQGNQGNIYDYYLTGYYLLFILFISILVSQSVRIRYLGVVFLFIFLYWSWKQNISLDLAYINSPLHGEGTIVLGNQRKAIDWVYKDSQNTIFNVDVYVPPVIPYSYDYLFNWYEYSKKGSGLTEMQTPLLYTIYEVDPPHPERLTAWLERQKGIATIEKEVRFGGIVVQRRTRLVNKK